MTRWTNSATGKSERPLARVFLVLFSGLLCALQAFAQPILPAIPVDSRVQVRFSGIVLNRATNTFDTVASITNIGTTPLFAPMSFVVTGITNSTVHLANASGATATGQPYLNLPLVGGSLSPGAALTSVVLKFSNPQRTTFAFTQSIYGVPASLNHAPVANAGPDQTVAIGATVALDGTRSTDIDGNALAYRWSLSGFPNGSRAILANPTSVDPSFVVDVAGAYTVQLIVNDGQSDSTPATVAISNTNSRPVGNAGRDQLVATGAVVHLDATHSTDVDGDSLTYLWAMVSTPAGSHAVLDAPTSLTPSFTADKAGAYQARLVVNDGHSASTPDFVTVSTQGVPPIADPGPDQAGAVSAHVQLDGSKSAAANGGALSYRWALIALPAGSSAILAGPTSPSPTFTVDKAGIYAVQLIVNDGSSDSVPRVVVIATGNVRPVADAGSNQSVQVGQAVVLDGSASHDANGDTLGHQWALLFKPSDSAATLVNAAQPKATLTCDVAGTFVAQLIVSDDELDSTPATATVTVSVAPQDHDPQVTSSAVVAGQVGATYRYQVVATDQDGDLLSYALSVSPMGMSISATGLISWTPGAAGSFAVTVRVTDGRGGSTTQSFHIVVTDNGLPPDPATVAPKLDPTGANSMSARSGFLYTGPHPIQSGVAPGTIDPKRVSVLRGNVADGTGAALTGVDISIAGHPEFGHTLSRLDGMFDMAANGGGRLTVHYAKTGYLPAQRQVQTSWQEFTVLPDVVLLHRDPNVTSVNFGTGLATMQVARGSMQNDADGSRRATVLFPAGTTAALVQPNGSTLPASTLNVRLTEYTVGANGPKAMPGDLPPTSTYTYAVELGADEAVAKVNGRDVVFNQPAIFYVENFMHVPVGQIVPNGYYDPVQSTWIGAPNGQVIKLLGSSGGIASIDIDGDGIADSGAALAALGISDAERRQLATLYAPGTSLWRTPMDHFSTNDQNWSFVCIPTDCGPPTETPPPPPPCCQDEGNGSVIGFERQTLGEDIAVVGTPFTLHYESDRTPGRTAEQGLSLSLASKGVPNGVKAIQVEILVAGQKLTQSIPTSTGATTFAWDGNDAYGRPLNGSFAVTTRIGYTYDIVATAGIAVPSSWARFSGIPLSVNGWRTQITLFQETTTQITRLDQRGLGLGGWSLSALHSYDPSGHMLNLGDGTRREVDQLTANVVSTIAGDGTATFGGDGVSALKSGISSPAGLAAGADGSVYIVDNTAHRVIHVDANGIQTTVAGTGVRGSGGDGGPAIQAQLANPTSVAVGLDGSVYIADRSNARVRRVAPNGIISTFAGTGLMTAPVEGSLANATPIFPRNVAVGPDGRVFITDAKHVWVVDQNGVINAYAGADVLFGGDGGPALQAGLQSPSGMAFASDGSLYFIDNDRVRKVTPQGIISTVAGPANGAFNGDGGPATSAGLDGPRDLALGRDGSIYIAATNRVRRVGTNGIINTFAGNGAAAPFLDGGPGPQSAFTTAAGIVAGPDQAIYVADAGHHRIRRIASALPGLSASDILVPSDDGEEAYVFSGEGRHLRTIHSLTGATLLTFTYDANGYPVAITDGDGNVTTIQRNGASPTAIVAPFGQRTTLTATPDGWLSAVSDPAGQARTMEYSPSGLLVRLVDPRGNAYRFTYDGVGRLIKDEDPAGGSTSLVRTEQANGYTVTMASALGRTRSVQVEQLNTGALRRTSVEADATKMVDVTAPDGSQQITDAAGMVSNVTHGADPRWGMLAPTISSATVSTPGGRQLKASEVVTTTLTDPQNPLSLSAKVDTFTTNGRTQSSAYTAATRTLTATSPLGRRESAVIDSLGRATQYSAPTLQPIVRSYDSHGLLQSSVEGSGADTRTSTIAHNSVGYIASVTNPLGQVERYAYDAAGRVTTKTFADGGTLQYAYDSSGNVTTVVPPGRPLHGLAYEAVNLTSAYSPPVVSAQPSQTQFQFDADHQLTQIRHPDGSVTTFQYDFAGRTIARTTPRGTVSYGYDASTGQIATVSAPGGAALSYAYDGGLLTTSSMSGPVSGTITRTYDNDFRLGSIAFGGVTTTLTYDADSALTNAGSLTLNRNAQNDLLTGSTLGNTTDAWTYDGFARPIQYRALYLNTALFVQQYTRDKRERIVGLTETIGGATNVYAYNYDPAGRLVSTARNGVVTTYTYDANGNLIMASGTSTVAATFDAQDRLIQYGSASYAYGPNGDLRSRGVSGQTTTYQYDTTGALTAVTLANGTKLTYLIDGKERRVGKFVNGALTQGFIYLDDGKPLVELDAGNNVVSRFIYATRDNVPDYMVRGGITYRLFLDHLGSPRLVVNVATGEIVQRMDFDDFGRVLLDTNPGFQPFGFAGGLLDRDTQLVRFGARDYDANSGRWTSKDPVLFAGDDTNLYRYVRGDPINQIDPSGRWGLVDTNTKDGREVLGGVKCEGGKLVIKISEDGLRKTRQFRKCITAHEQSHIDDFYAAVAAGHANGDICKANGAEGKYLGADADTEHTSEHNDTERRAWDAGIKCLQCELKHCHSKKARNEINEVLSHQGASSSPSGPCN